MDEGLKGDSNSCCGMYRALNYAQWLLGYSVVEADALGLLRETWSGSV